MYRYDPMLRGIKFLIEGEMQNEFEGPRVAECNKFLLSLLETYWLLSDDEREPWHEMCKSLKTTC